jgi:predicted transcriptional regulator
MKLHEAREILEAELLACEDKLGRDVINACGADLMSDVLAFSKEKVILLTGLVNPQVIRTAEMMDIKAVAFVRGKNPTKEVLALAEENSIVIMRTTLPMYTACGRLYQHGLRGGGEPA